MKKNILFYFSFCLLLTACGGQKKTNQNEDLFDKSIVSGAEWHDTDGNVINAHGGGILYHEGTYYWYGEYKGDSTYWNPKVPSWECYRTEAGGVSCYSSQNLVDWKFEGLALPSEQEDEKSELHYLFQLFLKIVFFHGNHKYQFVFFPTLYIRILQRRYLTIPEQDLDK